MSASRLKQRVVSHRTSSYYRMVAARGMVSMALIVAGCQDLPEIEYKGEKVRVGVYGDAQLCAGDIARMDAFVRQVERDLDAHANERIDVYLYDLFDPPSSMPKGCDRGGCFDRKNERVFTSSLSLEHELVHAVVHRIGRPADIFYNEGIAEALTDARTIFGRTLPGDNLGRSERSHEARETLDVQTAAHFVRWLWEEHDRESLRRLARGSSLADAYDWSFAEAEAAYLTDAPWAYPRRHPCSAPPMASVGELEWDETFSFSCEDENTFTMDVYSEYPEGGWYARHVVRTVAIERGGTFDVARSDHAPDAVFLLRCQLEPIAEAPRQHPSHEDWSILAEQEHRTRSFRRPSLFALSGQLSRVRLEPGVYELVVREPRDVESVRVRITPALEVQR